MRSHRFHVNAANGVRIFTSTTGQFRRELGDRITEWLATKPEVAIHDVRVVQSSDASFHCVTIVVFYGPRSR
jgi:hypothetical protein